MYEFFEHTADLGLRIRGDTLDGLFEEAARALFSTIVTNLEEVRPLDRVTFAIQSDQLDELLRDWLAELLYAFEADRLVLAEFDVDINGTRLSAVARGEPMDPGRHEIDQEIKAVTYHRLKVQQDAGGWLAEVILDI